MRESEHHTKILIALTRHPSLGVLLSPYTFEYLPDGTIELAEHGVHLQPSEAARLTSVEQSAIKIAASYSERNLMRIYSRETAIPVFLKKLTEDQLKKTVRPFIDKKLIEMLELIRTERIPFYQYEKGTKILFDHNRINVPENHTEITFHFEADNTHFHYALKCRRDGKNASLLEKKPVTVLTASPASVLLGNELHLFQNISSMRITPFTNKTRVSVDVSETDKYLEKVVLPILRHHEITYSGLRIFEEKRTCEPRLFVEESIYETTVLRLSFHYGNETFYPGSKPLRKSARIHNDDSGRTSIRYYCRDIEQERQRTKMLKETHLALVNDSYYKLREDAPQKDITEWIVAHRLMLTENFRLLRASNDADYCLDEIRLEQNMSAKPDWFELNMTVIIGTLRIPFSRFRNAILAGRREYLLPDGRMILLPEEWFYKYTNLLENIEKPKTDDEFSIHVKNSFVGLIESAFSYNHERKKRTYQAKEQVEVPKNLKATLRHYQEEGFNWMIHLNKHHFGGCLADDMGLGKTLQTLSVLQYVYNQEEDGSQKDETQEVKASTSPPRHHVQLSLFDNLAQQPALPCDNATQQGKTTSCRKPASLIVMPTSLMHNWRKEIKRFTTLHTYEFTGNGVSEKTNCKALFDRYNLILISYGIMRNHIDELKQYRFEYVVLDESQYIKNSDSQTFKMAITLQSNRRLALTGTPIENSLKDLWSQFHFLQPDLLGPESVFQKEFLVPIKQGNKRIETKLQQLTAPFILRRCKKEVAPELPQLTEEIVYCEMTQNQNELYSRERNGLRNLLIQQKKSQEKASNLVILNGLNQLRQLACHPRMVDKSFSETSGKLQEIVSTFETLKSEGHKVLIFSSFVKHLELVAEAFRERDWAYALLTGSSTNREEEIKRFADTDHIQAFLISLKAGGVGLNLTQADYVFIIDPWWNPAAELQAIGRAHRIGQEKHVFAYRFITENSIEEKIIRLQDEKKELFDTFISENNPLKNLSDKEWAKLLR